MATGTLRTGIDDHTDGPSNRSGRVDDAWFTLNSIRRLSGKSPLHPQVCAGTRVWRSAMLT
jgi:hypothetical protein